MKSIFVVSHDGGCEGHSLGYIAFETSEKAFQWMAGQTEMFDVIEVPIFPELPSKEWFRLEPLLTS